MIDPSEGFLGDHMAVIIRPSPQNGIKQRYQIRLFGRLVGLDDFPDFAKMRLDVRLRRFYQQLAVVLAKVPSKKIKPVPDMRHIGFLHGQNQTAFRHYRTAFALSSFLFPHSHRRTLRSAVPEGSYTRFPRSTY